MSLNQLIASYGREAATAPIEGYMKGVQFGSQMDQSRQARALGDLQIQQEKIQLGEAQRTTTPEYISEQERIAAEDRQIKNDQLQQVTEASRAQVAKWEKEGKLKDRKAHMEEAAPILRAASQMQDPIKIKEYLQQNKEVLYKYLDDEGDKAMNTLFEKGGAEDFRLFSELGYAGTLAGMEEAQKLSLLKEKNKGKKGTENKPAKEGSKITGSMIALSADAPSDQAIELGSASRGLTERNASLGLTQDDISSLMIDVYKSLREQKKNATNWDWFVNTDPSTAEVKMATQQVIDEQFAQSSGRSTNTVMEETQQLPPGLTENRLEAAMNQSGLTRQEVIADYMKSQVK